MLLSWSSSHTKDLNLFACKVLNIVFHPLLKLYIHQVLLIIDLEPACADIFLIHHLGPLADTKVIV